MAEHDLPVGIEDAVRAELAALAASGPQPDDAHLDALEHRTVAPRRHRGWAIAAAAAVVLALVGARAVIARSEGGGQQKLQTTNEPRQCRGSVPTVPLPARYRDEPRQLVPLSVVYTELGAGGPTGTPTRVPGDGTAEIRFSDGGVIRFTSKPGTEADAAPSPFPTTKAEADADLDERASTVTSGMTASGRVTTVETPVAISRSWLEGLARDAAELPTSMAAAVAEQRTFDPIRQTFALGPATFDRTVEFNDRAVLVGTDLTSGGTGGLQGDGGELAMLVGAPRPRSGLEFRSAGRYHWIVFVPRGLRVSLASKGDRCTAAVRDALTGGEYWLVQDGDGDEKATLTVTTKGRPDEVVLSKYLG